MVSPAVVRLAHYIDMPVNAGVLVDNKVIIKTDPKQSHASNRRHSNHSNVSRASFMSLMIEKERKGETESAPASRLLRR